MIDEKEKDLRKQELRDLGFRCIEPTKVRFLDGSFQTVTAYVHQVKASKTSKKVYNIESLKKGETKLIDESKLKELIGVEMFEQLTK